MSWRSIFKRVKGDALSLNRVVDNTTGLVKILGPRELGNNEIVAVELSCKDAPTFWRATGKTVYGGKTERFWHISPTAAPRVVQIPGAWSLSVGVAGPGSSKATATILPAGQVFAHGGTVTYESSELEEGASLAPGSWDTLPDNDFAGYAPYPYVQTLTVGGSVDARLVSTNPLKQSPEFLLSGLDTFVVPDGYYLEVRHPGGDTTSRYVVATYSEQKL